MSEKTLKLAARCRAQLTTMKQDHLAEAKEDLHKAQELLQQCIDEIATAGESSAGLTQRLIQANAQVKTARTHLDRKEAGISLQHLKESALIEGILIDEARGEITSAQAEEMFLRRLQD